MVISVIDVGIEPRSWESINSLLTDLAISMPIHLGLTETGGIVIFLPVFSFRVGIIKILVHREGGKTKNLTEIHSEDLIDDKGGC